MKSLYSRWGRYGRNCGAVAIAIVSAIFAFAIASSEIGASNAVRAIPVPFRVMLSAGVAILIFVITRNAIPTVRGIPHERRRITWAALAGWALACFAVAFLLSGFDAMYLAFGFGRHARLLTPPDWILSRAILGGIALTAIPWMIILRTQTTTVISRAPLV